MNIWSIHSHKLIAYTYLDMQADAVWKNFHQPKAWLFMLLEWELKD